MSHSQETSEAIHYGPVYERPVGASLALCDMPFVASTESRMLSKSMDWVNCPKCLAKLEKGS